MNEKPDHGVGDIVKLKRIHPYDSSQRGILRVRADSRLKYTGCKH